MSSGCQTGLVEPSVRAWAAVVLAGGTAARLDGADKASLELAGRTLLEHALSAVESATEVVVVGQEVPTSRPVTFRREDPPFGGPAAGLLAGRAGLRQPGDTAVLAVDLPHVTAATFDRLWSAAEGRDGAVLRGADGRRRLVLALAAAAFDRTPREAHNLSIGAFTHALDLAEVPAQGEEAVGIDTWADLRELRE
jgi:molybdopterin-guanine dinucleotide biosynthesis protein A